MILVLGLSRNYCINKISKSVETLLENLKDLANIINIINMEARNEYYSMNDIMNILKIE